MPEPQNNPTAWPRRRLGMTVLLAANMMCYADRYVLSATVPFLRHDIFSDPSNYAWPIQMLISFLHLLLGGRVEDALIGLLNMAFMVTYMVGSPIFASLSWKRWYIIGLGVILWSFASGGSGLVATYGQLLLVRCLVGVGEAAYGPLAPTLVADMNPATGRAMSQSIYQVTTPVGSAIGYALGGLIAASRLGWRFAYYISTPLGLVVGCLCFFLKDPAHEAHKKERKPSLRERMREFSACLGSRSYVYNVLAGAAMTFAMGGIAFWAPSYIVEYRQAGDAGMVTTLFGVILVVAGISGTMVGGWYAERKHLKDKGAYMKVSSWAMIWTVVATFLLLITPFPYAWGFLGIAVFFLFFNTGSANAIITDVIAPALRPSAFALYILVIHALGDVISPFIIGAVSDKTGGNMNIAFGAVLVAAAIAAVIWWFGAAHLEADSKYADQ